MSTKNFDVTVDSSLPVVQQNGLNTKKAANFESTLNVDGAVTLASTVATGAQTVTGANAVTGTVTGKSATAVPATAGAVAAGAPFTMFSDGPSLYVTSDVPTFTAVKGSICINTAGSSTSTRLYVNNGTTNWVAITTAS